MMQSRRACASALRALTCALIALAALAPSTAIASGGSDEPARVPNAELEAAISEVVPGDATMAYNVGLALAMADRIGEAVVFLERAHLAAPLARDVQDALAATHREARRRRADASPNARLTEGEPEAMFWWRAFSIGGARLWQASLLVSVWVLFGALLARRRAVTAAGRDALLVTVVLGSLIASLAAGMLTGRHVAHTRITPAVVIASEPRAREAPDELSRPQRQSNLYEGAVVIVRAERGGWRRVELVDGTEVWVEAVAVEPL